MSTERTVTLPLDHYLEVTEQLALAKKAIAEGSGYVAECYRYGGITLYESKDVKEMWDEQALRMRLLEEWGKKCKDYFRLPWHRRLFAKVPRYAQ
jgi:hypothetical protein